MHKLSRPVNYHRKKWLGIPEQHFLFNGHHLVKLHLGHYRYWAPPYAFLQPYTRQAAQERASQLA